MVISVLFFGFGAGLYFLFNYLEIYNICMYYFVDYWLFGAMFVLFAVAHRKVISFSIYKRDIEKRFIHMNPARKMR